MVKIRLARVGRAHQPSYRVVVADSRIKRSGRNIAILGMYNPLVTPAIFKIDKKVYEEWIKKGAQPTERVQRLVTPAIIKTFKYPKAPKKEQEAKPEVGSEKVEKSEKAVETVEAGSQGVVESTSPPEAEPESKPAVEPKPKTEETTK